YFGAAAVLVVAVSALSGCATILTLNEDDYRSKIYSGTRAHMEGSGCAHGICIDMPFSLAADTLLLPITIPWTVANFVLPPNPERFGNETYRTVNRGELLNSVNERTAKKDTDANALWYQGTWQDHHYIAHVYRFFGASD